MKKKDRADDIEFCETLLTVGKNQDKRPWPETSFFFFFFIKIDSACRNQQGNCDEVENSARPFLLFSSIVVKFMQ